MKRFLIVLLMLILLANETTISHAAVTTSENEWIIFRFLIDEMGFNTAGACGVLANIYKESRFNPNTTGDSGTSYGICQWHNQRWTNLQNWCDANGYDWKTLDGQLHFLKYELSMNNSNVLWNGKRIYNYIVSVPNTAQGAYDAAYYWCYYFEVPANKETVSKSRGTLAMETYWPEYSVASDETPTPGLGDINADGVIDTSDAQAIFNHFMGVQDLGDMKSFADVNQDELIDTSDAQAVFNYFMGS